MRKNNLLWLFLVIACCLTILMVSCFSMASEGANEETMKIDGGVSVTSSCAELDIPTVFVPTVTKQDVQPTKTKAAIAPLTENLEECNNSEGIVQEVLILNSSNSKEIITHIYLPPCYSENQDRDYPLLVLLHGQSYNAEQWLDMGLKDYLDMSFANQKEGIIVVLPEEHNYLQPIIDSSFDDMIVNDLLKYLKDNYHISSLREERAIGGISRGAIWALNIALNHWEEFGVIGLHSYPGGINSTILLLQRMPEAEIPAIFIDIGNNDAYRTAAAALNEELNKFQIPHEWHLNEGSHTQEYWSENLPNYMKWYIEHLRPE